MRFYCSTRPGEGTPSCILAAPDGADAWARRHRERCTTGCEALDGAWCLTKPPGSSTIDQELTGDRMACFVDEASCNARRTSTKTEMLCAPMAVKDAMEQLDSTAYDRMAAPTLDYHCADVPSTGHCYDTFWSCGHWSYRRFSRPADCVRTAKVWCFEDTLYSDKPISDCYRSAALCDESRDQAIRVARSKGKTPDATACELRSNPSMKI